MQRNPGSGEGGAFAAPAEGQLDLAGLARALWRRRRWIVVPAIVAAVASAVFVNLVTPRYRSETRILIESRETAFSRPEVERTGDRDRPLLDAEAVQSQVQLALSRDLARQVVRELKLGERPEFNPDAGASPVGRLLALVRLARDPSRMTLEERMLERYYDRLSVYQVEKSRVIAVDFWSENPLLAAEVANAVADGYLAVQQAAKQEAIRQASHWLAREIDQMRLRVAEAEARVEEFRSRSNLYVGSNNNPLSAQQLAELNSQLVVARSQKADVESKARLIRDILRSGRPIESSDIVNSELIRRLSEQRVILRAQLAEQSSTLLERHPRIKELRAQIADLESQIRAEAEKLVRSLENDARIAGARVETLTATLDQMKHQAAALNAEDVQLRALEREAKAQRDLLESYLARYRDVTAREGADAVPPDARIVSRAVPSPSPYFPKKIPIVLIATLATMMCAVTFVALGELLPGDARRAEPDVLAAGMLAPPPAARIAAAPEAGPSKPKPQSAAPAPEWSLAALAERVRGFGRGIVVVAGAGGSEPTPKVAIELARELGRQGARVLFLDLDPAAGPGAALISDPRAAGLAELLTGAASFGEVIHRDRGSPIHVVVAGRSLRDTAALLDAERLAIALGALSQTYDQVIAFASVLAPLAGAARLARFARAVVLVAEADAAGAGVSDALAARGFANVMLMSVEPEAAPPDRSPDRAAA